MPSMNPYGTQSTILSARLNKREADALIEILDELYKRDPEGEELNICAITTSTFEDGTVRINLDTFDEHGEPVTVGILDERGFAKLLSAPDKGRTVCDVARMGFLEILIPSKTINKATQQKVKFKAWAKELPGELSTSSPGKLP